MLAFVFCLFQNTVHDCATTQVPCGHTEGVKSTSPQGYLRTHTIASNIRGIESQGRQQWKLVVRAAHDTSVCREEEERAMGAADDERMWWRSTSVMSWVGVSITIDDGECGLRAWLDGCVLAAVMCFSFCCLPDPILIYLFRPALHLPQVRRSTFAHRFCLTTAA